MNVMNEHTQQREKRVLNEVYYSQHAAINLISLDYMQVKGGYILHVSDDQRTCYLTNDNMQLKFVKTDGLYRMRVPRATKMCSSVRTKPSSPTSALRPLHHRLDHAAMSTTKSMVSSNSVLGVNCNSNDLQEYDCLACMTAKQKRISFKQTEPRRGEQAQRKLAVDICSVGVKTICGSTMFLLVMDEASFYKWIFLLRRKAAHPEPRQAAQRRVPAKGACGDHAAHRSRREVHRQGLVGVVRSE